jgi:hypothetical protein
MRRLPASQQAEVLRQIDSGFNFKAEAGFPLNHATLVKLASIIKAPGAERPVPTSAHRAMSRIHWRLHSGAWREPAPTGVRFCWLPISARTPIPSGPSQASWLEKLAWGDRLSDMAAAMWRHLRIPETHRGSPALKTPARLRFHPIRLVRPHPTPPVPCVADFSVAIIFVSDTKPSRYVSARARICAYMCPSCLD